MSSNIWSNMTILAKVNSLEICNCPLLSAMISLLDKRTVMWSCWFWPYIHSLQYINTWGCKAVSKVVLPYIHLIYQGSKYLLWFIRRLNYTFSTLLCLEYVHNICLLLSVKWSQLYYFTKVTYLNVFSTLISTRTAI